MLLTVYAETRKKCIYHRSYKVCANAGFRKIEREEMNKRRDQRIVGTGNNQFDYQEGGFGHI